MPKNILRDVMTKERRTIREVPLPRAKRREAPSIQDSVLYEREDVELEEEVSLSSSNSSGRKMLLWGVTVFFILLLGATFFASFSGATITVTPRTMTFAVENEFTASSAGSKLRFETLPVSETAEILIPADTTKSVKEKARGTIVIYNNFSEKPQRLIKNTRFETQKGLIYRIDASVIIPGRTVKAGRTVPGSVEAIVFADSPGAEYNIPLSDFTIPGFKSDASRFAGFYARSKTPIAGGIEGTIKTPSDTALAKARASLQDTLRAKINKEKEGVAPPGYVLFSGAFTTHSESLPPEARADGLSAVREKIIGTAYLFRKDDLVKAIALLASPDAAESPVAIPNLESLRFEFNELPSDNSTSTKSIRFTLSGNAKIVWLFDEAKLKSALLGKPRAELLTVLSAFPTIGKADLVLRPFWSRTIPSDPKKISIEQVSFEAVPKINR